MARENYFFRNDENGKVLFFSDGRTQKTRIASGIQNYFWEGNKLFFEVINEGSSIWAYVKDDDPWIVPLGKCEDGYFAVIHRHGLLVSFFDEARRFQRWQCEERFVKHCSAKNHKEYQSVLILKREDGSYVAFLGHKNAVGKYSFEAPELKKGQMISAFDKENQRWTFVAKEYTNCGRVEKLGLTKKRWHILEADGVPFYPTFWERLFREYSF